LRSDIGPFGGFLEPLGVTSPWPVIATYAFDFAGERHYRSPDGRDRGPDDMAAMVPRLLNEGVRMIGGCCGTSPDHLRAMRRMMPN